MTASLLPVAGIHGAPRSGTTWLGQLFNSHPAVKYCYQPFFSHAFRGRADLSTIPDMVATFMENGGEEGRTFFTDVYKSLNE